MNSLEEVIRQATAGRCAHCLRPLASDDDWERYEGGEGSHLCWEANVYACGWVTKTTAEQLQAEAIRAHLLSEEVIERAQWAVDTPHVIHGRVTAHNVLTAALDHPGIRP